MGTKAVNGASGKHGRVFVGANSDEVYVMEYSL